MLSVQQLRNPPSRQAVYAWLVDLLKSFGFETTGWQRGRIQRAFLYVISTGVADLAELGKILAEFSFNDTATGDALNEFSKSRFANEKTPAIRTVGPIRLISVAQIPYTIQVGQLRATTNLGIVFRNTTGGTLAAGSTASPSELILTWEAELAGARGNVALGAVNRLLTPLAGVSVSNDVLSGDNWYSTAGADEESDESIRARNRTKWADQSIEGVRETVEAIARANGAAKVYVDDTNPRGAGTVDVYVSGTRAVLGSETLAAIQDAFSRRFFHTESYPASSSSRILVRNATAQEVSLSGWTVYYDSSVEDVQANVIQAINDLADVTPIGGWDYSPGPTHVLTRGDLLHAIESVEGVRTCTPPPGQDDITVGSLAFITPAADNWDLVFVPVT